MNKYGLGYKDVLAVNIWVICEMYRILGSSKSDAFIIGDKSGKKNKYMNVWDVLGVGQSRLRVLKKSLDGKTKVYKDEAEDFERKTGVNSNCLYDDNNKNIRLITNKDDINKYIIGIVGASQEDTASNKYKKCKEEVNLLFRKLIKEYKKESVIRDENDNLYKLYIYFTEYRKVDEKTGREKVTYALSLLDAASPDTWKSFDSGDLEMISGRLERTLSKIKALETCKKENLI